MGTAWLAEGGSSPSSTGRGTVDLVGPTTPFESVEVVRAYTFWERPLVAVAMDSADADDVCVLASPTPP